MGLFGNNYNKPGPGIPKDAPKKTGAALFFEILGREFWALWGLNLTYILACLPIITIGPATAAMYRVTINMVRDQNTYAWKDFWDAFKKNLKQGLLFGIPATIIVLAAIYLDLGLTIDIMAGSSSATQIAFIVVWNLLCFGIMSYVFPLVAYINLPWMAILKNSLLLMFLGKLRTLAAVAVTIGLMMLAVLYFPFSIFAIFFIGFFSFSAFFISFMVWDVIEKYVINGGDTQQDESLNEDNN